jgi:putative DNA primase/helicase
MHYDTSATKTQDLDLNLDQDQPLHRVVVEFPLQIGEPPTLPQIDTAVDPARGVEFVLGHFGATTVVALHPDKGPKGGIWLDENTKDEVIRWIEERNRAGLNIYLHPNQPRYGLKKKANKGDIEFIRAVPSDIDCYKNGRTMSSGWAAITTLPRQPTVTIASGGGFHGYYVLQEALPATPEIVAQVEAIGERLAALTGGDPVQNVDRIMRMPFTQNYPNDSKRKAGRTVCASGVVSGEDGPRHTVEQLETAFPANVVAFPGSAQAKNTGPVNTPIPGTPPALARGNQSALNGAAKAGTSRRPHSLEAIAAECPQVKLSLDSGGAGDPYPLWYALLTLAHFCDDGKQYAREISQGDQRYDTANVDAHLQRIADEQAAKGFGAPTCAFLNTCRSGVCQSCPHYGKVETPYSLGVDDDDRPPAFSDEALALQFSTMHGDDARYVADWGKWLWWTRSRWQADATMQTYDLARAVCRRASAKIRDPKLARLAANVASAKTVAAVVSLARADRRHAAIVDQWDADAMLLNTPGGIVDLRTGVRMPNERRRYMTKSTAVVPGGDCPLWRRFLTEITGGDTGLQEFLQRISGYALTGDISEHALFFLYGAGGNGKGVYLNTFSAILGDYAAVAPMETFIASRHEQHPTDLASLRGARLVTAQETEKGRRWAESKIKTLTGGDPISARFMRQDFFTFNPQFKLLIAGNYRPGLRGVDAAIRRRFNLVPFIVAIANPDKKLRDKLRGEWSGILKWAIDGCLAWQRIGLAPPPVVRDATDQYLADEDTLAQWIDECCDCDKLYAESSAKLFESWKAWAEKTGEFVGIQRQFTQALKERGFTSYQESGTKRAMFRGIGLRLTAPNTETGGSPDTGGDTLAAVAKRPITSVTEGQATLYEIFRQGEARRG